MGKLTRSTILKNQAKKKKNSKVTIEELLQLAEECMDRCDLETAYKYAKQALDIDGKSVEALESMAAIQMEMGNSESSKSIYQKLVELSPNEGFSKYMCLAQLSTELEAVEFYKKGIELMIGEYDRQGQQPGTSVGLDGEEEETGVTRLDISTAFGSIAEIYLTDLCMEENAADLCKSYLDKSLDYDSANPETLQLLASYWLSKDDLEQAKKCILQSVENWLPKYVEASEQGLLIDPTEVVPLTYDSRINTSRILTEVQEFDTALTVLEQLVEEDDEVVVVWYMLGWVNYCKGEEYFSNAKYYLKRASEMAAKIKYEQKYLDGQLREHVAELLAKLVEVASEEEDEEREEEIVEGVDYETGDEDEEVDENNNLRGDEECMET